MIDETELMLGDWIYLTVHKTNARVTELRSTDPDVVLVTDKGEVEMRIDMKPIPITEDILLKNGFKETKESMFPKRYILNLGGANGTYIQVNFNPHSFRATLDVYTHYSMQSFAFSKQNMSVHELQHAMRMCGIEKEIEL